MYTKSRHHKILPAAKGEQEWSRNRGPGKTAPVAVAFPAAGSLFLALIVKEGLGMEQEASCLGHTAPAVESPPPLILLG